MAKSRYNQPIKLKGKNGDLLQATITLDITYTALLLLEEGEGERVEKGEELGSLVVVVKMSKGIKIVMKEEWPQVLKNVVKRVRKVEASQLLTLLVLVLASKKDEGDKSKGKKLVPNYQTNRQISRYVSM